MPLFLLFFFNDTPTTEIYTLSLHDALPISRNTHSRRVARHRPRSKYLRSATSTARDNVRRRPRSSATRSEEHTSELQSLAYLVCRLLLEKKKKSNIRRISISLVASLRRSKI